MLLNIEFEAFRAYEKAIGGGGGQTTSSGGGTTTSSRSRYRFPVYLDRGARGPRPLENPKLDFVSVIADRVGMCVYPVSMRVYSVGVGRYAVGMTPGQNEPYRWRGISSNFLQFSRRRGLLRGLYNGRA